MNYITREQFNNQKENVKKELIKYWKPSEMDIFIWRNGLYLVKKYDNEEEEILSFQIDLWIPKKECIPLLTLQNLIDYIEEKTNGKIEILWNPSLKIYLVNVLEKDWKLFGQNEKLLLAIWELACKICMYK